MSYTDSKLTRMQFTTLVLLTIEAGLRCRTCDLHSKFEKDRTKTMVAIVNEREC